MLTDISPGSRIDKSRSIKTEEDQLKAISIVASAKARNYLRLMEYDNNIEQVKARFHYQKLKNYK